MVAGVHKGVLGIQEPGSVLDGSALEGDAAYGDDNNYGVINMDYKITNAVFE